MKKAGHFESIRRFLSGFFLPVSASALMLRLSFAKEVPGTLVFFALIPLFVASGRWNRRECLGGFFLTGILFYYLLLSWIRLQTYTGMIAAVFYLSLYFLPFGILVGEYGRNILSVRSKIALALLWSMLEYIRSEFVIGFPWALLGASLHKETILIQTAELWGVFGLTFIIVFINLCLASLFLYAWRSPVDILRKLRFFYIHISIILFAASFLILYGETRLSTPDPKKGISFTVGLIQPNVPSDEKWNYQEKIRLMGLYKRMSLGLKNADLIVWPESVLPGELYYDSRLLSTLNEIIEVTKTPILLGSGNMAFEPVKGTDGSDVKEIYYNSTFLLGADGRIRGIYDKIILVPFGEYIPFQEYFPQARLLTPIEESYHPGKRLTVFDLEKEGRKVLFSSVICIEDIYPSHIRKFIRSGARFIVNVTNDGWYANTPCAYQHYAHAVLRSVENRVPLVRCANTGISAVINAHGETEEIVSLGSRVADIEGILKCAILVEPDGKQTFYARCGDAFIWIGALFVILYLLQNKIYRLFRAFKRRDLLQNGVP